MQKRSRKHERKAAESSPTAEEIETMLRVLNRAYRQTQEGMTGCTRSAAKYAFQNTCTWLTERHIGFSQDEKTGIWKLGKHTREEEEHHELL